MFRSFVVEISLHRFHFSEVDLRIIARDVRSRPPQQTRPVANLLICSILRAHFLQTSTKRFILLFQTCDSRCLFFVVAVLLELR